MSKIYEVMVVTDGGLAWFETFQEYNDALLMVYLACMTKGTASINELADKFNIAFDNKNRRRGLM